MDQVKEFGPFTPQDLEKAVDWLQANGLKFKIAKDEQAEKLFKMNDGQNIVQQVEFRTQVYLAQVFMVQVDEMTPEQEQVFSQKFSLAEVVPKRFSMAPLLQEVGYETKPFYRSKRVWATVIVAFLLVGVIFNILQILSSHF